MSGGGEVIVQHPFPTFTATLDRRLRADGAAPLAVGFSGGGDSLALLILTLDWARAHGRPVVSLTVDHQINPASAAWTAAAVAKAQALGATTRALSWSGAKPATGLPAAARAARHALLADAARAAGASVLLLGHTADDLAEAAAMRAEGSTVSDPRDWAPSPAWPQGRGVFLLRPLLDVGRRTLRDWLTARGEAWLDDPANDDLKYARARARRAQASPPPVGEVSPQATEGGVVPPRQAPPTGPLDRLPHGGRDYLVLPRAAPAAHVAAACLCAAGTSQPPRGERLRRLVDRLRAGETFTATLAGARIEASGDGVRFFREPGEARRQGPPPVGEVSAQPTEGGGTLIPLALPVGETVVWDGRYEITATVPGLTVRPLQGLAARLPAAQRRALKDLPAAARSALPAIVDPAGTVGCPILAGVFATRVRCLVLDRFEAAVGRVDQEAAT
ncbi:tRNA(Ile)-lysidine synthetase [Caulobacter sp. Root655]|uniref:tRNA lysidine(34) synthetase TilS n=1 Tax=Caulobacter sp. Root655 TaxID=1736578 RepID=UPI0006FE2A9F|nr:tRNA lysidine(34) synthetase TilS [Caulobacter sp. Root655]KRA66617.1 tRNA(Ile)-lysidine synthetase [Caulobacter sp. Root655]